jgi:cell division protein FtsI/penicillin-binding protein 2
MALAAATIANSGNAISPYLVDATRAPGAKEWTVLDIPNTQKAVVTQDVANGITTALRTAVTSGAARAADRQDVAGLVVRGHASTAYTGQQQIGWFIGYTMLSNGHAVAVAVTVENADASVAAQVGGTTLVQATQIIH